MKLRKEIVEICPDIYSIGKYLLTPCGVDSFKVYCMIKHPGGIRLTEAEASVEFIKYVSDLEEYLDSYFKDRLL